MFAINRFNDKTLFCVTVDPNHRRFWVALRRVTWHGVGFPFSYSNLFHRLIWEMFKNWKKIFEMQKKVENNFYLLVWLQKYRTRQHRKYLLPCIDIALRFRKSDFETQWILIGRVGSIWQFRRRSEKSNHFSTIRNWKKNFFRFQNFLELKNFFNQNFFFQF